MPPPASPKGHREGEDHKSVPCLDPEGLGGQVSGRRSLFKLQLQDLQVNKPLLVRGSPSEIPGSVSPGQLQGEWPHSNLGVLYNPGRVTDAREALTIDSANQALPWNAPPPLMKD